MVNRHELRPIGKRTLHLHLVNHIRNTGQNIFRTQQLLALVHKYSNGLAIADKLEKLCRDKRHGFGIIETQAPGIPLLREKTRVVQHQFVNFFGR